MNSNTGKMIDLTYGRLLMSEIEMKNQSAKANYSLMVNGTATIDADQSIIDVKNDTNLWIFDTSFQNNTHLLIYTADDTTMVLRNSVITRHNGIVATVDTHSSTTLFDELPIESPTTSDGIVCLVGDINPIPQPFVGLKNVKFVRNARLLLGQLLSDSNVSNIHLTSSISSTAPESSDATQVYNNSDNITMIRNTIYLFQFKYHRSNIKTSNVKNNVIYSLAHNLLLVKILNNDICINDSLYYINKTYPI